MSEDSTKLPPGMCCRQCALFAKCEKLFGCNPTSQECDFYPVRFSVSPARFMQECADSDRLRGELSQARAELAALRERERWIPVQNMPFGLTGPYWAVTGEFGFPPTLIVAKCWMGSENREPIWYLDEKFYHLDSPLMVAEQVSHYRRLPEPPERQP